MLGTEIHVERFLQDFSSTTRPTPTSTKFSECSLIQNGQYTVFWFFFRKVLLDQKVPYLIIYVCLSAIHTWVTFWPTPNCAYVWQFIDMQQTNKLLMYAYIISSFGKFKTSPFEIIEHYYLSKPLYKHLHLSSNLSIPACHEGLSSTLN